MTIRSDRLNARAAELRTLGTVAQIRINNAERGIKAISNINYPAATVAAFNLELSAARAALAAIGAELRQIVRELDSHTTNFPDGAMILVETTHGPEVYERRDPNAGDDNSNWYKLGADGDAKPTTLESITGDIITLADGTDRYHPYPFVRLYSSDEVDNIIDLLG
jgi:hypothetical protein